MTMLTDLILTVSVADAHAAASHWLHDASVMLAQASDSAADGVAASTAEPGPIRQAINFILKIQDHLKYIIEHYGTWVYAVLFLIVFCETGLVVTPFLPGDSLLFAAGALSGSSDLNIWIVMAVLLVAAILGDAVNYWIGSRFRGVFASGGRIKLVKPEHLERTRLFFDKYGGKAIVIARFVPIVRTVAPFFAGLGAMEYRRFVFFNIFGAVLWVGVCCGAGYFFGGLPFVKKNFELVVIGIIVVSLIPLAIEAIAARRAAKAAKA
jgi:membrane-associated protein